MSFQVVVAECTLGLGSCQGTGCEKVTGCFYKTKL